MVLLTLTDVSLTYDAGRPLLDGVSLTVRDGDRIGLIGPNGAGKSTLLKLLGGLETPTTGERAVRRGARIGYLEQEPRFDPERRVRDIVAEGLGERDVLLEELERINDALSMSASTGDASDDDDAQREAEQTALLRRQEQLHRRLDEVGGHEVEHRVEATIAGVGLEDPDARAGTLSGGEARRAALGRLLITEPDLLLLDEPTNHLDAFVVAWLEQQLIKLRVPLVLVTHDRYLLDRVADRIVEIERGKLIEYDGGYGRYLELRAARLEQEQHTNQARRNMLRRETAWMRRGPPARSTKAKARIQRYDELVEAMPDADPADLQLAFPPGPRLGNRVLELHGVAHRYGENEVLPKLDLELHGGMRLGVVGPNGAGKTTLLRILLGRLEPSEGRAVFGDTLALGTVDQKREDLDPENTVVEELTGGGSSVVVNGQSIHVASFLDGFLFPGETKNTPIGKLSGGERGRILIAKLMLTGANVLVLDEPTNDLDLATLRALEEALVAFKGVVVVVSHDRWFLDRVATHVLHLDGHGGARLHTGDVTSLLDRLAQEQARGNAGRDADRDGTGDGTRDGARDGTRDGDASRRKDRPAPPTETSAPRSRRLAPWERRELSELEARLPGLEAAVAALDAQLADPALYQGDKTRVLALQEQRRMAAAELDAANTRWEALAERE